MILGVGYIELHSFFYSLGSENMWRPCLGREKRMSNPSSILKLGKRSRQRLICNSSKKLKVLLLNSFGILERELWKVLTFSASDTARPSIQHSLQEHSTLSISQNHCIEEINGVHHNVILLPVK